MIIDQLVLGVYENNCYVLKKHADSKECVIVDTGLDVEPLVKFLEKNQLEPVAVLCTHGHADHIAGVSTIREKYPEVKVVIHKNDAEMLTSAELNLSMMANIKIAGDAADVVIENCNETISFAGLDFKVLCTPGHTPGGVCYHYCNDVDALFCGDTIFSGSVGRTDFPGYDQSKCHKQLLESVEREIFNLSEETKLYPGHGPRTTVGHEKEHNPFFSNL